MTSPPPRPASGAPVRADDALLILSELGGVGLHVQEVGAPPPADLASGVVRVGVSRGTPTEGLEAYDILLTTAQGAPAPWVSAKSLKDAVAALRGVVERQPTAAAVAAQVHRMTLKVSLEEALTLESLAYSMLLGSPAFQDWRKATPVRIRPDTGRERVLFSATPALIRLRLNRPEARNAFDARMRDELCEAFEAAMVDPDQRPVLLEGEGPSFSAGGDLDEFGSAQDLGQAHLIRTYRSAAWRAHRLGPRLTVHLHGACVGAGIEVPAAAARVAARPGAVFRLPEVSMGLIPGAGGTATIPRRIGRHRACYMAIAGENIDLATALTWGLADEVVT